MVYQQFRIDPEQLIQQVLTLNGTAGDVAHCQDAVGRQPCGNSTAHAPEVRKRCMFPQQTAVSHLVQFRDAHAVLIGRHFLGYNVHRYLAEIKVRANASGGGDACLGQHLPDDFHGQLVSRHPVILQVGCHVHKNLVDGIDMDVLRGDVAEIYFINACAVLDVMRHAWLCHQIVHGQLPVCVQFLFRVRFPGASPLPVHLTHPLHHLEQPWPAADSIAFQRRRYGQTDGLFRPRRVGHDQARVERVKSPFHTFYRGVE